MGESFWENLLAESFGRVSFFGITFWEIFGRVFAFWESLLGVPLGESLGKVFWESLSEPPFGRVVWESLSALPSGKCVWEINLELYFEKVFWESLLGESFGESLSELSFGRIFRESLFLTPAATEPGKSMITSIIVARSATGVSRWPCPSNWKCTSFSYTSL